MKATKRRRLWLVTGDREVYAAKSAAGKSDQFRWLEWITPRSAQGLFPDAMRGACVSA